MSGNKTTTKAAAAKKNTEKTVFSCLRRTNKILHFCDLTEDAFFLFLFAKKKRRECGKTLMKCW